MSITVNENGILHNIDTITVNDGGVLHELLTVHANEGGTLREIFSAWRLPDNISWTTGYTDIPTTLNVSDNGFTCNATFNNSITQNTAITLYADMTIHKDTVLNFTYVEASSSRYWINITAHNLTTGNNDDAIIAGSSSNPVVMTLSPGNYKIAMTVMVTSSLNSATISITANKAV